MGLSRTSKEYIAYMVTLNLGFFVFQSLGLGPLIDATSLQAAMLVGAMLSLLAIPFYFLAQRRSQGAGDELQAAPALL